MWHLTAQLLFSQSFPLLLRRLQGWRAEVGHDHEELLEADLLEGTHLILVLIPVSQKKSIFSPFRAWTVQQQQPEFSKTRSRQIIPRPAALSVFRGFWSSGCSHGHRSPNQKKTINHVFTPSPSGFCWASDLSTCEQKPHGQKTCLADSSYRGLSCWAWAYMELPVLNVNSSAFTSLKTSVRCRFMSC